MEAIAPNGKTYTVPAYKEASVRATKQDTYAPGQFVTLDLYGGPVDAMVMWRSDELYYRKGSAYRVKVLRDRRQRDDVERLPFNRMVLVHEGMMSATD